jgi:hypothetical protein
VVELQREIRNAPLELNLGHAVRALSLAELMDFLDLTGLEATGANLEFLGLTIYARTGSVEIRVETTFGRIVRV